MFKKLYDWNISKQNFCTLKVDCPRHTIVQRSATKTTQKILFFSNQLVFNKLRLVFFEVVLIFLKMILGDGTGKSDKFYKKPESCRSKKKPKNVDNYYNTPTSIVEKSEKGAVDNLSPYLRNCLKNKLEPAFGKGKTQREGG